MLIHLLAALGGASRFVELNAGDGGTVQAADGTSPYDTTVAIRFNTDGTVETGTSIDSNAITWSAAGQWIDPLDAASSDYSVRYTNRTGTEDFTTKAAAEDTWIDLGTQRLWSWNEGAALFDSFTCDFEVRDDVGTRATGSSEYTFSIENV